MSQKLSRREFAARAAAVGSAAALAASGLGQDAKLDKKPKADPPDPDFAALERQLEKPLPDRLRTPAKAALKTIRNNAKERQKFKLPEGSEPCTTFIPLPPRSEG